MTAHPPSAAAAPAAFLSRRAGRLIAHDAVAYLLSATLGLLFVAPFLFGVAASLMDPSEMYVVPPRWLPSVPVWENYARAWTMIPFPRYVLNTSIITVGALVGQLVSAALVGYGFARFRFPGRSVLFLVLLGTMIMPSETMIIPQFLLFKALHWLNTFLPLIVPSYFGASAFSIFLMRQFMLTLPRELDEAATIDGAGSLRILLQILVPLSKPVVATIVILSFVYHWNDFFHPLIYLDSRELHTVSIGLNFFKQEPSVGSAVPLTHLLLAASITATVPVLSVFLALQRYFVQGIVMSGIKR